MTGSGLLGPNPGGDTQDTIGEGRRLEEDPHLDGGPDLVQLLTPEGERREHPDYGCDLDDDTIKAMYRDLVLVRRVDSEGTALQRQGQLGIWASLLGQEAAQIGSVYALRPHDYIFPTYREHGVAWCRGVAPADLYSLFRGVNYGGWNPADHNFHLYTIVIGAQTLHATGYAMGVQRDGCVGTGEPDRDTGVLAYFGDGASSQGDVNEAFIWAGVYHAPIVFFCQNNQWAISQPIERQTPLPLYRRAAGFGFPGIRVDGNDVLACYAVTQAAMQRAREGSGPSLVEAFTYRMGAHTTTDDPTRYRLSSELEHWKLKDPIARVKAYLARYAHVDEDFFAQVDAEADELAARVRQECHDLPDPDPGRIFDLVYADQTPELREQQRWFENYRASFADGETAEVS